MGKIAAALLKHGFGVAFALSFTRCAHYQFCALSGRWYEADELGVYPVSEGAD